MVGKQVDRREFLKGSVATSAALTFGLQGGKGGSSARAAGSGGNKLPFGQIKGLKISRLFCGGNLIGGWAHSRDLQYVSSLVKAYHTDKKVFETLEIAEENGINAILTNPVSDRIINKYWDERGGKIQWISDCASGANIKEGIKRSVDNGAHAVYIQGGLADSAVGKGQVELLGEALEYIKERGVPGGLGAHLLETVVACEDGGLEPDFWVKTLHSDKYWSATPAAERKKGKLPPHDNMWCTNPVETIAYMKGLKRPWIAFKVMAAGAIHPREGFKFAYENGADFICAGMFDFQIIEDVIIARDLLAGKMNRQRSWMA